MKILLSVCHVKDTQERGTICGKIKKFFFDVQVVECSLLFYLKMIIFEQESKGVMI